METTDISSEPQQQQREPARGVRPARNDRELLIERTFSAPRSQVFACWTDPMHARQWWGPHGFIATSLDLAREAGGTWRGCMRNTERDDYDEVCAGGELMDIVDGERIVYTWGWESNDGRRGPETLVTVTFVDDGVNTRMYFRQGPFESVEDRESHESGWNEAFDKLAEHVEQHHH